jgi:hypothetical protein
MAGTTQQTMWMQGQAGKVSKGTDTDLGSVRCDDNGWHSIISTRCELLSPSQHCASAHSFVDSGCHSPKLTREMWSMQVGQPGRDNIPRRRRHCGA